MKVSIIRDDNMVYVDGRPLEVDCSSLPDTVQVVQWNGTSGHIEFDPDPPRMPEPIETITPYTELLMAWERKRSEIDAPQREPTLAEVKATLERRVDGDAERARLRFITGGIGMAITYGEKHDQAQAVELLGEDAVNAMSAAEQDAEFPTLYASVGVEAPTLWQASQMVIASYERFSTVLGEIERARKLGKQAVRDASDAETARAACEGIQWPNP